MKNQRLVLEMAWMALYAAMFIVLDYISNQIPFFRMPNGGTLGFSTIVLLIAAYHLGWRKGVVVALLTIPLQGFFAPFYFQHILGFVMEYVLAFAVYGLAPLFPKYSGIVVVNTIRFLLHLVAGVYFWGTTWWASFSYNAWYMVPTMIVGLIFVPLIVKRLRLNK